MVNAYGPTEASVCATTDDCAAGGGRPAIGRPLPGVHLRVLDDRGAPVPPGVPGELWIGGIGVAHGYLGRAALTAQRFAVIPAFPAAGSIAPATGPSPPSSACSVTSPATWAGSRS